MTRQDRTMIMVIVCVVIGAASWFLLIHPKREEIKTAKEKVAVAQRENDEAVTKASVAQAARAGYERDHAAIARLGKALPVDDNMASLVYQLETTAKQSGVDFRAVSVAEGASAPAAGAASGSSSSSSTLPGQVTPIPLTLTFDGGYFAMTRFLRKIERYTVIHEAAAIDVRGRLISVDSVKLAPGPEGFPNVSAEVAATVYTAPLLDAESQSTGSTSGGTAAASTTSSQSTPAAATAAPAAAASGGAK